MLAALIVVYEGLSGALCCTAGGFELFGCVKGIVGISTLDELLGVFAVDGSPFALAVGGVGMPCAGFAYYLAVLVNSLVGDYPAPAQRFNYVLLCSGHKAVRVGIFDSEDEISSSLLGVQIVIERRADTANMQRAGRRRRKAYSCLSGHLIEILFLSSDSRCY